MPLGLQYENDIWNEYFSQRIYAYENKMKQFKSVFEQLNDYFKVHDKDNMFDVQSNSSYEFCFNLDRVC